MHDALADVLAYYRHVHPLYLALGTAMGAYWAFVAAFVRPGPLAGQVGFAVALAMFVPPFVFILDRVSRVGLVEALRLLAEEPDE